MAELLEEHVQTREKIKHLYELNNKFIEGDTSVQQHILESIGDLSAFYKQHIEKENTHFFVSAREYLKDEEWEVMMREFADFDRSLIHDKYKTMIAEMEGKNA